MKIRNGNLTQGTYNPTCNPPKTLRIMKGAGFPKPAGFGYSWD